MKKQLLENMLAQALKEKEALREQVLAKKEEFTRNHSIGNFAVINVRKDYRTVTIENQELTAHEVELKHISQDVKIVINNLRGIETFGWSSNSYRGRDTIEEQTASAKEARLYIQAVSEMLMLAEDRESTMRAIYTIVNHYTAGVEPLIEKLHNYSAEIAYLQKEIKNIEKEEELENAKQYLVGKTRYVSDGYYVTKKYTTNEIIISEDKGKLYIDNFGRRKSITEQELISIYKHVKKTLCRRDWNDNKYYSYPNELPSKDAKIIETEITKEAYCTITR